MANNRKGNIMLERAENFSWAYDVATSSNADLILLDNVQFIYELSMAEYELNALGVDFEIINGLREFKLKNKSNGLINKIKKRSAYFKTVDNDYTDYFHIIQKKPNTFS